MESSAQVWDDFFRRYYWDQILELARDYPDRSSLIIDFMDLQRFDLDISDEVSKHPERTLKHARDALKALDLPSDTEFDNRLCIRIKNYPDKIRRRDLRGEHINKIVCIDGLVQRTTEVSPKILNAAFKCQRCGDITYILQDDGVFKEPFECSNDVCGRKNTFKLMLDDSEKVNFQKVRLQEAPEDLNGGEKTQFIDLNLYDDLVGTLLPGQRAIITGILKAHQVTKAGAKGTTLELYIDVLYFYVSDGRKTIFITPEDKARMLEVSRQPNIVDNLVKSFAPTIHGMYKEKEGMLVSRVSNGFKVRPDGTIQRDYSHILICGDPGLGKSGLKHALKKCMPDLGLASGTGSTKAGLTAAAIKDDFANGSWSIEAGSLPLADMGGLVIDEFDKFSKDDVRSLNDALSNCQFEKSAAGLQVKLWTRCFVIGLLNPKFGRFNTYDPIPDQLNLPPDTLSRFDLIFIIKDQVNEDHDKLVARRMLNAWAEIEEEPQEGIISYEDLQKYLVIAQSIKPKISPDVLNAIEARFIKTRKQSTDGRIAITNRHVEALIRLSRCEAQLCLSDIVTLEHFDRAARLLEASLCQIGVDESGNYDADIITSGYSKSQRDKIQLLKKIISDNEDQGIAQMVKVIEEAKKANLTEKEIENIIEKLKHTGDLYTPKKGYIKGV